MNRRGFVVSSVAAAAGAPLAQRAAAAPPNGGPGFHLGCISYNTLKDFDVETIIRVLEGAGFEGVELRTGHKHGVEPTIGQEERLRVRRLLPERSGDTPTPATALTWQISISRCGAERVQQVGDREAVRRSGS